MILTPLLIGLAVLGSSYRDRFPLPSGVVPDGWGVNIHFTKPKAGEVEAIRAAGFRWVRMDLLWHVVEKRRGVYDFREYDTLMGHLQRVGLRPMFILCYGNDLYQKGAPTTPAARRAFARFAGAAVARYKGRGVVWEMWNEPNLGQFWQPRADVEQYIALARATGAALRKAGPEEWWVGPATSGFDWEFLTQCFEGGLLHDWDAVSVHPYRQTAPESVGADWARLRALMRRFGSEMPMLSGEWGYSERYAGMNARKQADYAVRQYVANLAAGVNMSIWYDWRDDGQDPNEIEHHFGTVSFEGSPKPAYEAIRTYSRALEGWHLLRSLPGDRALFSGDPLRVFASEGGTPTERAATPEEARALRIPWPDGPWVVGGVPHVRAALKAALDALPPGESLAITVRAREIRVTHSTLESGAQALADALAGDGMQLLSIVSNGQPVWAGWAGFVAPVGVELRPEPAQQRMLVVIQDSRDTPDRVLDVELAIGPRVLRQRVALRGGRGEVSFPWYPWEARSSFSARVLGEDGVLGVSSATTIGETIDLMAVDRWEARPEGDAAVFAEASVKRVSSALGGPSTEALRLDYRAAKGWRYVVLADRKSQPLAGTPDALLVWVYGDASGDMLRMRFEDSKSQTFQPDYGPINWRGWRRIRFSLRGDRAGFWGGPVDGVVHYPIRVTVPVLVDLVGRAGSGSIQIAGVVVVGSPTERSGPT